MYIPTKGKREIVLYGRKEPDAIIKVDGVVQEHEDGVIYRIPSSNDFHGWFDIFIEGMVEIHMHNCYAKYPIYDNSDELSTIKFKQYKFCLWMYPENYGHHNEIEYKHLILNGPSYIIKDADEEQNIYDYDTNLKIKPFDYAYNMHYIREQLHNEME